MIEQELSDHERGLIYEDSHLLIRHVNDSAVPGMYTIEPQLHKESLAELSDTELALLAYTQRQLRIGLKTKFNVVVCGLYVEEHPGRRVASYTIPFHIDRLAERFSVDVYQPYTEEYLRSYTFSSSSRRIDAINTEMRYVLNSPSIKHDIGGINRGSFRVSSFGVQDVDSFRKPPEIEEIIEVFDESELPKPPEGKKYFICIGGDKNFQCFLSEDSMSKGEFLLSHEDELDDSLKPVYSDDQMIVRQDSKYAIPGFYVISPKLHYRTIGDIPQDTYQRCIFMSRDINQGLSTLGLQRAHVYHDEKYRARMSAHFWVIPLHESYISEHDLNPTIYSRDIWTYLDSFSRFNETKSQILQFNKEMKRYLDSQHRTTAS